MGKESTVFSDVQVGHTALIFKEEFTGIGHVLSTHDFRADGYDRKGSPPVVGILNNEGLRLRNKKSRGKQKGHECE